MTERPSKIFRWAPPESAQVEPPIGKQDVGYLTDDPVYAEWMNFKWANDYQWKDHFATNVSTFSTAKRAIELLEAGDKFILDLLDLEQNSPSFQRNIVAVGSDKVASIVFDGSNFIVLYESGYIDIHNRSMELVGQIGDGYEVNQVKPPYMYADGEHIIVCYGTDVNASIAIKYDYNGNEQFLTWIPGMVDSVVKFGFDLVVSSKEFFPDQNYLCRVNMATGALTSKPGVSAFNVATDGKYLFYAISANQFKVTNSNFTQEKTFTFDDIGGVPFIVSDYGCIYIINSNRTMKYVFSDTSNIIDIEATVSVSTNNLTLSSYRSFFTADASYLYDNNGLVFDKRTLILSGSNTGNLTNIAQRKNTVFSNNEFLCYVSKDYGGQEFIEIYGLNAPPSTWVIGDVTQEHNIKGLRAMPAEYFRP